MKNKYTIEFWQDDEYVVYEVGGDPDRYVFKGTLVEVEAWISLKEKGFEI